MVVALASGILFVCQFQRDLIVWQMIITYGQSCKCDFTLRTSENEIDTLPLLKMTLKVADVGLLHSTSNL